MMFCELLVSFIHSFIQECHHAHYKEQAKNRKVFIGWPDLEWPQRFTEMLSNAQRNSFFNPRHIKLICLFVGS